MSTTILDFPQYHFQYFKEEPGFLFGDYQLRFLSSNTPQHILDILNQSITIIKWTGDPPPLKPNPNIIGLMGCQYREVTDVFFMPRSVTRLFHAKLIDKPKNHLLLIEHSLDEKCLDITLCPGQAYSPYWGLYTKAFEGGKFIERILELKNNLISIEDYNSILKNKEN